MDEHDMLGTEGDNSPSDSPPDSPIHSSVSPPRSRKRTNARRNPREKFVIRLDQYNRPLSPRDDVVDLSRHAGKLARREIPLIYSDFRDVPTKPYYERVIKGLNEHYVFENFEEDGVDCEYVRQKVKDAWKGYKSKLKRKRVDGKDPAVVKLEDAPKGHPIEDWRMFVDNCNTEEMQIKSAQNSDNRAGCEFPNCSGRIPAQVVRHEIAKEKGVPDSQVGLGRVYRAMHTKKKDKALQNPEDADGGDSNIEDSEDCNVEDDGDFRKGRLNAIGAGVTKTLVKKMEPIVKRHENEEVNSKMWKNKMEEKFDGLATVVSQFIKSVDANHIQSPSMPLSGLPYGVSATSMYTQKPSMLPRGQDRVVGVSPLNNTRRTSLPTGGNCSDVDASLTTPIPLSDHRGGDSSSKFTAQMTSMPSSRHNNDASGSMTKPIPVSGHHLVGDSFTPNKRKLVLPSGLLFDGSSPVNIAKSTSMSPSGHSYNLGTSVTKSVPQSGYSPDGDSSIKSNTGKTLMASSGQRRDGLSPVNNNTQKTSMSRSGHHYDIGTSVTKSVPLSGHHHDGDSSPKNNSGRTSMPPSGHCYDGSSSVNNTKKTGIPPTGDHCETSTSVKTPKTSMLLSGHRHDGGSSSAKNSSQMQPMVSKEHHHEVSASLFNNSKGTTMLPSGKDRDVMTNSKGLPKIAKNSTEMQPMVSKAHQHEVSASLVKNSKGTAMYPSGKDCDVMTNSKGLPKIVTGDARNLIGTKVKVRGGWPSKVLALGAIKAVHPLQEFEGRKLGLGNFLIYVDSVMCPTFQLPEPHGEKTTLGQVEGGHVIWPRDDIKLM